MRIHNLMTLAAFGRKVPLTATCRVAVPAGQVAHGHPGRVGRVVDDLLQLLGQRGSVAPAPGRSAAADW